MFHYIFLFYKYYVSPIDLIDRIVKSKIPAISITSINDIIPTIIKAKKYYIILKQLKFIKCSNRTDIVGIIVGIIIVK